jgi:hypothetical protein
LFNYGGDVVNGYGYVIFGAIPVLLGYTSALIVAPKGDKITYPECAMSAMWTMFFAALAFLLLGVEGFICIAMAAPMAIPLALIGAALAYGSRRWVHSIQKKRASTFVVLGFLPLMLTADVANPTPFVHHVESSSIVIDAPPERIWPMICNLPSLPPPAELLFRNGIAYPISIETKKAKIGGLRTCRLSTGDMPEVIEVCDPGRRLEFKVLSTPPCMVETSPYGQVQTKHLKGYFECLRGQFLLERMPGNKSLLIGSTWYKSRYAPDIYWTLWNDTIVEEVHQRVMREIKRQAELPASHG